MFKERLAKRDLKWFEADFLSPTYRLYSSESEDGKRTYMVPAPGAVFQNPLDPAYVVGYKSVTTVIDEKLDKSWLQEWIDAVGVDEANRIKKQATLRGSAIHKMAERLLLNEEYWVDQGTINIQDFNRVIPVLSEHVNLVYGVELQLFSHRLKTAGTSDVVCQWDSVNSILDFKTARKIKTKDQIEGYHIQAACYAMMVKELYGLDVPQIVIIMLVDHENKPEVFVDYTDNWVGRVNEVFKS